MVSSGEHQPALGVRLEGDRVALRPAAVEDAQMLVEWHASPHIARYWENNGFSLDEMVARIERRHVLVYIVEADDEAIGYLHAWFGHPWFGNPGDAVGLDMFLLTEARGQGLGGDAVHTLARRLRSNVRVRIVVDPYLWNEPGIRFGNELDSELTASATPTRTTPPNGC